MLLNFFAICLNYNMVQRVRQAVEGGHTKTSTFSMEIRVQIFQYSQKFLHHIPNITIDHKCIKNKYVSQNSLLNSLTYSVIQKTEKVKCWYSTLKQACFVWRSRSKSFYIVKSSTPHTKYNYHPTKHCGLFHSTT